ncbi:MAG TPA: sigma-70 family RNA polymerase sigma factor [Candidatus Binatia bacterium]
MSAGGPTSRDPSDGPGLTLGDLLHSDSKVPVSEEEWVDLVRRVAAGDERALRALYDRASRIVFTLSMRITDDRQAAEEVTLDVFHDVWRRAASYDAANGTVVGWIMNQARSRSIDRLRAGRRKKRVDHQPGILAAASDDPQDDASRREEGRALHGALTVLNPKERRAIEMAYFSGLTHAEVAERLEEPLGTVKTRIRSGLDKLRRALVGRKQP